MKCRSHCVHIANILQRISTITIKAPALKPEQLPKLDQWLRTLLWDAQVPSPTAESVTNVDKKLAAFEVYRLKARLPLTDGSVKMVQGVRELFEIKDAERDDEEFDNNEAKIVIIGRDIGKLDLEGSYFSVVGA